MPTLEYLATKISQQGTSPAFSGGQVQQSTSRARALMTKQRAYSHSRPRPQRGKKRSRESPSHPLSHSLTRYCCCCCLRHLTQSLAMMGATNGSSLDPPP